MDVPKGSELDTFLTMLERAGQHYELNISGVRFAFVVILGDVANACFCFDKAGQLDIIST